MRRVYLHQVQGSNAFIVSYHRLQCHITIMAGQCIGLTGIVGEVSAGREGKALQY